MLSMGRHNPLLACTLLLWWQVLQGNCVSCDDMILHTRACESELEMIGPRDDSRSCCVLNVLLSRHGLHSSLYTKIW